MFQPINCAVDSLGRVWAVNYNENNVSVFASADLVHPLFTFGGKGSENGKFNFNEKPCTYPDIEVLTASATAVTAETLAEVGETPTTLYSGSFENDLLAAGTCEITTTINTTEVIMTDSSGVFSGTLAVTAEAVGTGDGTAVEFALDHTHVVTGTAVIKVDGVTQTITTDYTIDLETGVVTFTAEHVPANGLAVTADYTFVAVTGVVNYLLGTWSLIFNVAPDASSNIVADYSYDKDSRVFVSDTFNHRIQVFNIAGGFVKSIGSYGTDKTHLCEPCGMTSDGTLLHVVDRGNNRINCITLSTLEFRNLTYGSLGHDDDSGLCFPTDILYIGGATGVVYVTDTGNNRIVSFEVASSVYVESSTYVIKEFSNSTASNGSQTLCVIGLEKDVAGNFYTTDYFRMVVAKYNSSWTQQTNAAESGRTLGKVYGARGLKINSTSLFVSDTLNNEIDKITLA